MARSIASVTTSGHASCHRLGASSTRVAELLSRADALSVKVEEARLLRNALARCRGWQRKVAPSILATFLAGGGGGLAGALRAEQLDEWLSEGEQYRVECEL